MTAIAEGIVIDPGLRGGKPCVMDTRVTVQEVLHWLAIGMTPEEIVDDFPYLSPEKIRQVLAYAAASAGRYMILAA